MYKCADCGNTEKFTGYATENGRVLIYKNDSADRESTYSWIYHISEENWSSDLKFTRCYECGSENIIKV